MEKPKMITIEKDRFDSLLKTEYRASATLIFVENIVRGLSVKENLNDTNIGQYAVCKMVEERLKWK